MLFLFIFLEFFIYYLVLLKFSYKYIIWILFSYYFSLLFILSFSSFFVVRLTLNHHYTEPRRYQHFFNPLHFTTNDFLYLLVITSYIFLFYLSWIIFELIFLLFDLYLVFFNLFMIFFLVNYFLSYKTQDYIINIFLFCIFLVSTLILFSSFYWFYSALFFIYYLRLFFYLFSLLSLLYF